MHAHVGQHMGRTFHNDFPYDKGYVRWQSNQHRNDAPWPSSSCPTNAVGIHGHAVDFCILAFLLEFPAQPERVAREWAFWLEHENGAVTSYPKMDQSLVQVG